MSKLVTLCSALVISSFALGGCTVRAQVKASTDEPPPPPPKKAEPKPKKKKKIPLAKLRKVNNEIELPAPVPFKTGSAELDEEAGADEILTLVKEYMDQNPEVTLLRVEGHTDSDGDDASNLQLSKDRSASVTKWLVDHSVACKRLMPVGFGETKPLVANDTPDNKAKNRRVSFFDATVKGKPVMDDKKQAVPVDGGGQIAVDPCNPAIKR
jgi:OmpA-OmpF porin, OOP family